LPIEVVTLKNGSPHSKTIHEYAIDPFKYSRSTNYDKPRKTTKWIWNSETNNFIPSNKIHTEYDHYGNKIEEHHHVYDRPTLTWKAIRSQHKSYYHEAFGLEKESLHKDELTGHMIRTRYTLSDNKKAHTDKIIEYKIHDETDWKPWQKFTMQHDNFGRITLSSTQWLAKDKPGPQKTFYTKDYQHDRNSGLLTVNQTSALGAINTEAHDTRNGNLIKKITPEGSVWLYEYDALNRLIKQINPLKRVTLHTHQDYDKDQINQTIKETPLGYQVAAVTDAAGRVIAYKDYHNNAWRTLSAREYNGWSKVIKQTNILGLEITTLFDQFERPVKHIDHWGNIKRIEYIDAQFTARTYINQHKVMEQESQPWLAKTIHRKYSIFDNLYDPQTHFLEETLEKNGFGQNIKHTSSLIHRYTLNASNTTESLYAYDPSFNRISKTINGFDGLQFTRRTQYDIFKNVVKHTKKQTKDHDTTQGETDLRQYNADNQLISVTTPAEMTIKYVNDKAGRRIKTIQPDGEEILYGYNPLGQLIKNSWMRGTHRTEITKSYDADNHLIALSDNNDQIINYRYLSNGMLHSITYPDGNTLKLDYNDKNQVTGRTDFSGKHYQFNYHDDDKGQVS
jgi:YD repeat-containing protein